MPIQQKEILIDQIPQRNILEVNINGKLTEEDYEHFIPVIHQMIERYGRIRILLELVDFHGWTAGALWEDTKFAVKHYGDIERLAIVGDSKWEKGMSYFCKPFTRAEIRYFDQSKMDEAKKWISAE
jgi:hypothetical protein